MTKHDFPMHTLSETLMYTFY